MVILLFCQFIYYNMLQLTYLFFSHLTQALISITFHSEFKIQMEQTNFHLFELSLISNFQSYFAKQSTLIQFQIILATFELQCSKVNSVLTKDWEVLSFQFQKVFAEIGLQSKSKKYKVMNRIKLFPSTKLKLGLEKPKSQLPDKEIISQLKTTSYGKLASNNDFLLKNIKKYNPSVHSLDQNSQKQVQNNQKSQQYRVKSISTGSLLKQKMVIFHQTSVQQKSQVQKLQQTAKQNDIDIQFMSYLLQIFVQLRNNKIINLFSNKVKTNMAEQSQYLIQKKTLKNKENHNLRNTEEASVRQILKTNVQLAKNILKKKIFQQKKNKLKITAIQSQNQIKPTNHRQSLSSNSHSIISLKTSTQAEAKHCRQNQQLNFITNQYHKKQLQIKQQLSKLEELNELITSQQLKLKDIQTKINHSETTMKSVLEQSNKICNFVGKQNNKLIMMASEEYKEIQSQIYDYAAYLQSNQLATSLTYQPLAFQCITDDIDIKMKNINKLIIQDDQVQIAQKNRHMRDFVMETINKFKIKDEKQNQLLEFKTKCIINFVKKMKRWLDNWTLKQEYLVNLRNEFASNSPKIQMLLVTFKSLPICDKCSRLTCDLIDQLRSTYDKIDCNYKLGNSFY